MIRLLFIVHLLIISCTSNLYEPCVIEDFVCLKTHEKTVENRCKFEDYDDSYFEWLSAENQTEYESNIGLMNLGFFNVPECRFKFDIELQYLNVSEHKCRIDSKKNVEKKKEDQHSFLQFSVNKKCETYSKSSNIGDNTIIIPFKFVFTGCYFYYIKFDNTKRITSNLIFLKTNYVKLDPKASLLKIQDTYNSYQKVLSISIIYDIYLAFTKLDFRLIQENTSNLTHFEIKIPSDINLSKEIRSLDVCYNTDSVFTVRNCSFQTEDNLNVKVTCLFSNMTTSNFRYSLYYGFDDRCKPFNFWSNNCNYKSQTSGNFEIDNYSRYVNESKDYLNVIIFIGIGTTLIIIISLLSILYLIHLEKKKADLKNRNDPDSEHLFLYHEPIDIKRSKQPKSIFLVYAKDDDYVMEFAKAFRNLLSSDGQCTIFDLYDDRFIQELAIFGEEWLTMKYMDDNAIFILLLTKMANYNLIINNIRDQNNNSHRDKYFKFIINYFLENVNLNEKILVCQLETDSRIKFNAFQIFNPYLKYDLPRHLNNLLAHIRIKCNIDLSVSETKRQQFLKTFDILKAHRTENLNLLETMY